MGWTIAGIIFVIILLLTLGKITVFIDYAETFELKVKYMFFPLVSVPSSGKKKRRKKRRKKRGGKNAANADNTADPESENSSGNPDENASKKGVKNKGKKGAEKEKKKLSFEEIIELVKLALDSLGKPLKKVVKRTEISHLSVDIICGGEDAAKAAISFGVMNIAVGNALGWLDNFFTLRKPDNIHVGVDFYAEKTVYDCYGEVKLTVAAALAFAFVLLGRALKYYFTHEDAKAAVKKMV